MNFKTILKSLAVCAAIVLSAGFVSCSDDEAEKIVTYNVTVADVLPEGLSVASLQTGKLTFRELNTASVTEVALPLAADFALPAGTYNVEGRMTVLDGDVERTLRAVGGPFVISAAGSISLDWFYYNPNNTLIFSEIYTSGSLNAKGTGGLYDSYFMIYNNTDEVQYADGLAICESKMVNSQAFEIVSPENFIDANFTAQTVYVIPGNGTSVPIQPGKAIKIVDQAINWGDEVEGALDHRDADFEWYDEVTTGSVRDTDNPDVINLEKWYSYSKTIWLPSNQSNRSYVLARMPQGMTAEQFVTAQDNTYRYIGATGTEMSQTTNKLIKYEWVLDGVNLCPTEAWLRNSLSAAYDISFAAISEMNSDKNRFGKKFVRKQAGVSPEGNIILQDTNDSANDFEIVDAK